LLIKSNPKVVAFQKFLTEQSNLKAVQVVANQTVVQAQAAARANIAKADGESQAIKIITVQLKESCVSSGAIH
jgi:hypothetical protein